MSLIKHERYSSNLLGNPCMDISPDQSVPRQVCVLLLVTLLRTYVPARLSLDNYTMAAWSSINFSTCAFVSGMLGTLLSARLALTVAFMLW
jgi:hypothetical protein